MVGINREVIFVYFGSNGVFSKKKKIIYFTKTKKYFLFLNTNFAIMTFLSYAILFVVIK